MPWFSPHSLGGSQARALTHCGYIALAFSRLRFRPGRGALPALGEMQCPSGRKEGSGGSPASGPRGRAARRRARRAARLRAAAGRSRCAVRERGPGPDRRGDRGRARAAGRFARLRSLHLHRARHRRDAPCPVLGGGRRHRAAPARPVRCGPPVAGRRDSRRPDRRAVGPAARVVAEGDGGSRARPADRPPLAPVDSAARRRPCGRRALVRRAAPRANLVRSGDYPAHDRRGGLGKRDRPGTVRG